MTFHHRPNLLLDLVLLTLALSGVNFDHTVRLPEFESPPLTSTCLDRLSVWIVWTHYAVDDYVTVWSNSVRYCRKYSMLKVVMSRLNTDQARISHSRLVFEILSFENFYVMTSPLTSGCLDRLSMWIVWSDYAVDDFVKIWSNSDKKLSEKKHFERCDVTTMTS